MAWPLYLIAFSIQLPLSVNEVFGAYYDRYSIVPAIPLFLAIVLALLVACQLLLRNIQLAGLAALIAAMALFPKPSHYVPVYAAIAAVGLVLIAWRVWRRKDKTVREALRLPADFTPIVNVTAVAMLVAIGARTLYYDSKIAGESDAVADAGHAAIGAVAASRHRTPLPHIVHIVLDGYSRADVLEHTYGFDNSPFLEALKRRGFRIADKATTPFNQTLLVMSAIFSLGAADQALTRQTSTFEPAIVRRMLGQGQEGSAVQRILLGLGYSMQSTPSIYLPLQWKDIVTMNGHVSTWNHFAIPETYIFSYDLLTSAPLLKPLTEPLLGEYFGVAGVNYRNLKDVPNRRFRPRGNRPQFIYQHILAPHPPFNITADGRPRPLNGFPGSIDDGSRIIRGQDSLRARYRDGYVAKLQYINGAILEQIDGLKETLTGPLVVIVHGDHGGGLHSDQDAVANTCMHERFSPLLAVFATDPAIMKEFTADMSLANIYRAIFRAILNADLPDLPNRSTYISWNLDEVVPLGPGALNAPCPTVGTWTADRAPALPPASSSGSISR